MRAGAGGRGGPRHACRQHSRPRQRGVVPAAAARLRARAQGGAEGGRIVAHGTPEKIAAGSTYTGFYLRKVLPKKGAVSEDKEDESD